jgi:hypothetical protein
MLHLIVSVSRLRCESSIGQIVGTKWDMCSAGCLRVESSEGDEISVRQMIRGRQRNKVPNEQQTEESSRFERMSLQRTPAICTGAYASEHDFTFREQRPLTHSRAMLPLFFDGRSDTGTGADVRSQSNGGRHCLIFHIGIQLAINDSLLVRSVWNHLRAGESFSEMCDSCLRRAISMPW